MKSLMNMATAALIAVFSAFTALAQMPYLDKNLTTEQRAEDLLGRLTLEEKASLMD